MLRFCGNVHRSLHHYFSQAWSCPRLRAVHFASFLLGSMSTFLCYYHQVLHPFQPAKVYWVRPFHFRFMALWHFFTFKKYSPTHKFMGMSQPVQWHNICTRLRKKAAKCSPQQKVPKMFNHKKQLLKQYSPQMLGECIPHICHLFYTSKIFRE